MGCNHTIHKHHHHLGWDNSNSPVLTVKSGETIAVETIDASGGQLHEEAGLDDLKALDFEKVNPVTGPAGAGPQTFRASVCWPTSSLTRHCTSGNTIHPC